MSWLGLVLVDLAALTLLVWVLNLVRVGRLYVGYGALLVIVLVSIPVTVSVPPLRAVLGHALSSLFASAIAGVAVLAVSFVLVMLVYLLSQITILANRLSRLIQELAIERVGRSEVERKDPARADGGGHAAQP